MKRNNIVYDKAFHFSIRIVNLYKSICQEQKEYVLSKQFLRSETSIGANIKEAIYGQSKKDFISKLSIALKEASETEYWLELLIATDYLDENLGNDIISDLVEVIKLLTAIINTSKNNISN